MLTTLSAAVRYLKGTAREPVALAGVELREVVVERAAVREQPSVERPASLEILAEHPTAASELSGAVAERPATPTGLRCKLTHTLLHDPVLAEDGYTYERAAWEAYVKRDAAAALVSPVTSQPVSAQAVGHRHLRVAAAEFKLRRDAQPPQAPFDLEKWSEDPITQAPMHQPVVLPDGMVCDIASVRYGVFGRASHPGRSLLDRNMTFTEQDRLLRDLNSLEISEASQVLAPNTLSRSYSIPSVASLIPPPAVAAAARAGAVAGANARQQRPDRLVGVVIAVGVFAPVGLGIEILAGGSNLTGESRWASGSLLTMFPLFLVGIVKGIELAWK